MGAPPEVVIAYEEWQRHGRALLGGRSLIVLPPRAALVSVGCWRRSVPPGTGMAAQPTETLQEE